MQALEACAGDLASGVSGHLMQRTSDCKLAAASPASCIGGLISRGVCTLCSTGACFQTRTQPGHVCLQTRPPGALARVLPCAPASAGKEGCCDQKFRRGGKALPRGSPRACLKVDIRSEGLPYVACQSVGPWPQLARFVRQGRAGSWQARWQILTECDGAFGPPRLGVCVACGVGLLLVLAVPTLLALTAVLAGVGCCLCFGCSPWGARRLRTFKSTDQV